MTGTPQMAPVPAPAQEPPGFAGSVAFKKSFVVPAVRPHRAAATSRSLTCMASSSSPRSRGSARLAPRLTTSACGDRVTIDFLADLQLEAARYRSKWLTGCWQTVTHPEQPAAAAAGAKAPPRVYCNPIKFWGRDDVKLAYPLLFRVAMWWMSVPLSSACVERSFSILHYMQDSNRMSMLDDGIVTELFIRCQRPRVERMAREAVNVVVQARGY